MPLRARTTIELLGPLQKPSSFPDAEQGSLCSGNECGKLVDVRTDNLSSEGQPLYESRSTAYKWINDQVPRRRQRENRSTCELRRKAGGVSIKRMR